MIDAFKRASAGRITAVVPYYAYGRSDKKDQPRVPDHRAPDRRHDQRRRRRPAADHGPAPGPDPGLLQHPGRRADRRPHAVATTSSSDLDDLVVVTDLGFAKRARTFAEILEAPLAIIEKRRQGNLTTGPRCSTSSARSRASAPSSSTTRSTPPARSWRSTRALDREGVTEIYACATHGVLSDPAIDRIRDSELTRGRDHRHHPAAAGQAPAARSRCCRWRRSSARPSAASTAASRSAPSSRATRARPGDAPVGRAGSRKCP